MIAESFFKRTFGIEPAAVATAPGRVNLIGEHTDYNGGCVLPLAIAQSTTVALRLTSQGSLRAASRQIDGGEIKVSDNPSSQGSFIVHLMAACKALAAEGYTIPNADIAVNSDVPIGSGLSSSAALLVATVRAFRTACRLHLSDVEVAHVAHRAEHDFVGVPVGTMDHMVCSLGDTDTALFLDTRSLAYARVALPRDLELVVIDSGVRHTHVTGGYRVRRAECEQAAAALGVQWLCDLPVMESVLAANPAWSRLGSTLQRRVLHVVSENRRVHDSVAALRANDLAALGAHLDSSHVSLRDWFAVSTPEVDQLVEATRSAPGCLGARMTGGGFGGAIVAVTKQGNAERVAAEAVSGYLRRVPGAEPKIIMPSAEGVK